MKIYKDIFLCNGNLLAAKGESVSTEKLVEHLIRGDILKESLDIAIPPEQVVEAYLKAEVGAALPLSSRTLKDIAVKMAAAIVSRENNVRRVLQMFSTRDSVTWGHSLRVALITAALASTLDIDGVESVEGALVHDVGKAFMMPLIQKSGKLTPEEFSIVKEHPAIGFRLLKGAKFSNGVAQVALYHHERANGSGYLGLYEEDIPDTAVVVAIADTIDAMASKRSYKEAASMNEVLKVLNEEQEERHLFNKELFKRSLGLITA